MVNKPVIAVAAAVVLAAAVGLYVLRTRHPAAAPVPEAVPMPVVSTPAEPVIAHPLPESADGNAAKVPLPSLADSDSAVIDALTPLTGAGSIQDFLRPDSIIRHVVVTADNLPRSKAAADKRPFTPVPGTFLADGDELHATLDPENFKRYETLVSVIKNIDMQKLAAVYIRFYPLFQQAYQDLGYPNGYFNDRLVQVIDSLLASPQPREPIELVRPNVLYVFADAGLEARPAGQKMLIRMGPENAAVIKAKLSELRTLITAAPPKR